MGFAGCVGDGGGDVVFLFFRGLLSPFLKCGRLREIKKRLLRLSEKTSITRVTTSVRFRAHAGKPWEVRCDTSTL